MVNAYKVFDEMFSENEQSVKETENQKSTSLFTEHEMKWVTRIDSTGVTFADVCGMDQAKRYLRLLLIYNTFPKHMKSARYLLFGSPGTGKSMLLKALVGEARARPETSSTTFFSISLPDLIYPSATGTVEELLKKLFVVAQAEKPSIIFIEDLDGLASSNTENEENIVSIRNAFCSEMKNIGDGVSVICTTNKPQKFRDYPNVLRHFEFLIYLSVPNKVDRLQILKKVFTENIYTDLAEEDFEVLAMKTRGYSILDLHELYRNAFQRAYKRLVSSDSSANPVHITVGDIGNLKRVCNLDLKYCDAIADILRARNGNIPLEPLPSIELSSVRNILFCAIIYHLDSNAAAI